MTLTDVMSGSGLTLWPIISLILFVVVFAGVIARVVSPARKAQDARAALLPLESDSPHAATTRKELP